MSVFIDTSALIAILDAKDPHHERARRAWIALVSGGENIICTNYVLVEAIAVAQRRLGLAAVRALHQDVAPVLQIEWIGEPAHRESMNALLTASRRQLSLIDCVSFETMRRLNIDTAFVFDPHFAEQGFACIPQT